MDTLGFIGYSGMGHSFPESRTLGNANHPLRFRTDATGAVWISLGAEYLPFDGAEGVEFNIGMIDVEFKATSATLRPGGKSLWPGEPGLHPGIFRSGARAWNPAGRWIRSGKT